MNKKAIVKLMEHHVIKVFLIISVLITNLACEKKTDDNTRDIKLLNAILDNSKTANIDSLFLSPDNSNNHIFNYYNDFLELKNDSFINMPNSFAIEDEITKEIRFVDIKKGDSLFNKLKDRFTLKIDSLVLDVFSEKEFTNYQNQIVENARWSYKDVSAQGVFEPNNLTNKRDVIHVSKPLYTKDREYALTQSFKNEIHGASFIEIYKRDGENWNRVKSIRTSDFQ